MYTCKCYLALEELGDVEEDGEEEDWEEIGEQVVAILCCILLSPDCDDQIMIKLFQRS